jgi:uncharacterized protein YjbI with pentapeptide repeats
VAASVAAPAAAAASPARSQLELERLRQEVRELKIKNDRAGSLRETILAWAPFATVLVAVAGVLVPVLREVRQQRAQREAELDQRRLEERRRFDDLFGQAVANLGSDNDSVQVSAAVTLHSFLRQDYSALHEQVYSVLCANLAVKHSKLVNRFIVRAFEDAIRLHLAARDREPSEPIDLAGSELPRARLAGLDLQEVDIAFATLRRADLHGSNLKRARGIEANLEGARLSRTDMTEARLNGSNGRGASFHEARLVSAEFRPSDNQAADLRAAEFYAAKLQGAHFDGADLRGAKFDRANLADTFFVGALFDGAALDSVLRSEIVDDERSWKKAHFSPEVMATLEAKGGRAASRRPARQSGREPAQVPAPTHE